MQLILFYLKKKRLENSKRTVRNVVANLNSTTVGPINIIRIGTHMAAIYTIDSK